MDERKERFWWERNEGNNTKARSSPSLEECKKSAMLNGWSDKGKKLINSGKEFIIFLWQ